MNNRCTPLINILSALPDFRNSKGKRHPLKSILAVAVVAMMCGYKSYSAIAEWGRNYGETVSNALGFAHGKSPCAATFFNVFCGIDIHQLELLLNQWASEVVNAIGAQEPAVEGISIDGKTLRGSKKQGSTLSHLLSVVSHRLGLTLFQQAVDEKTNEIPVCLQVVQNLLVEGRVVTVDALLTQREIAQTIVDRKGDYLMPVKGNQAGLLEAVSLPFNQIHWEDKSIEDVQITSLEHGRIETRRLRSSTALTGYIDWPGAEQIFEIERTTIFKNTGEVRHQVDYGITSLTRNQADANQLLQFCRGHWCIENKSHWVRDVTYGEDTSQVRKGNTPQVLAALRNTAIGVLRVAGFANIAAANRKLAAQPQVALALIGIQLEN